MNSLEKESSAYLKSASHQPVNWFPWSNEAFEKARELDKPILLDIGAVWCHWCHVLDRESYEKEDVAKTINENFIPVKVDRDERPDIDRRYQRAVAAITGQGGWPLTAFLTPDGKVFFGGTYFPPHDSHGLPSFRTVLKQVSDHYRDNRKTALEEADKIHKSIVDKTSVPSSSELKLTIIDTAIQSIGMAFDLEHGGFGSAPKFPHPGAIELLLTRHFETKEQYLLTMATKTLNHMSRGGVHDQIGGGFHRYSTDRNWTVPHFEKMSYDNSEILRAYLHGYEATRDELYRTTSEDIINFITTVLSNPIEGGFYASQDADVGMEDDGDYFTWTVKEIREVLAEKEASVALAHFNVQPHGQMRHNPEKNVPHVNVDLQAIANTMKISTEEANAILESARSKLFAARMKRPTPFVDKMIYTNWNGMMISAFAKAHRILGKNQPLELAVKSTDLLLKKSYSKTKGFYHTLMDSRARVHGILDDQVKMGIALLDVFEITGEFRYLNTVLDLTQLITEKYWDENSGGFFDIEHREEDVAPLKERFKPFEDDPVPAPNSAAAMLLDRLYYITYEQKYRDLAEKTLKVFLENSEKYGFFAATYFLALHYHINHPAQVYIIGERTNQHVKRLLETAWSAYRPNKLVLTVNPEHPKITLSPAVEGMVNRAEQPIAFVCAGTSCAAPTDNPKQLEETIRTFGLSGH